MICTSCKQERQTGADGRCAQCRQRFEALVDAEIAELKREQLAPETYDWRAVEARILRLEALRQQ